MRKINCELSFKKDLSNIELMGIERILDLVYITDEFLHDEFPVSTEDYGLAYTSSSPYAMYNVTECIGYNGQQVSHFAITENNMLIMVTYDEDENEYLYEIESSDY